jgi:hypothetical protein
VSTEILYNGINLFSGVASTPFVGRTLEPIRYGSIWGTLEVFSLEGQITGLCSDGLSEIIQKSQVILNGLSSTEFGEFSIVDNGTQIVSKPYVKVRSFNLEEDITVGIKPFQIELEAYEEDFFSGYYGVVDPTNDISYEETQEGNILINRTCSARGFNTSASALQNAIDYVQSTISTILPVSSILIEKNGTIASPVLTSVTEEINRLEGSYSLTKKYASNARGPNSGFLFEISYDISYSETEGVYQISANGSLTAGIGSTVSDLRLAFEKVKLYELCRQAMSKYNGLNINPNPLNLNVTENLRDSSLSFSASFNTDTIASDIDFTYDVSIELNDLVDLANVSFNGSVRGRLGQNARWNKIKQFYETVDVFGICQSALQEEFAGRKLTIKPSSYSSDFDERNGEIRINASFLEIHEKNKWSHLFRSFDYSLSFAPGVKIKHKIQTLSNGSKVFDINSASRSSCSISGTAAILNECSVNSIVNDIKSVMLSILAEYNISNYFVESISVTEGKEKKAPSYDFEMTVSYLENKQNLFLGG